MVRFTTRLYMLNDAHMLQMKQGLGMVEEKFNSVVASL
jgi:hypothetical protein